MKRRDHDAIEQRILKYVNEGYDTNGELARKMKMSVNEMSYFVLNLVARHRLFSQKIGRKVIYSTSAPGVVPAHDPFGLCHAKTETCNHGSQPVH